MYEKHAEAHRKAQLDLQVRLSQQTVTERPDLIIWPESMYPYTVDLQKPVLALPRVSDSSTTFLADRGVEPDTPARGAAGV